MKKVVIIDDEAAGRKLISEYLKDFPDLVCLGEANNGVDAVKMINMVGCRCSGKRSTS